MSDPITVDRLEWLANNTPVKRGHALALAVKLDEGEITPEKAHEAVGFAKEASSLEWVRSDHYPGDEYYDKADLRYGGIY